MKYPKHSAAAIYREPLDVASYVKKHDLSELAGGAGCEAPRGESVRYRGSEPGRSASPELARSRATPQVD